MVKTYPSSSTAHIFTVQGHPEFTPAIVSHMVDARSAQGIFDETTTAEARRRLGGKDGSGGEGYGKVGWAIWKVMLDSEVDQNGDVDMNGGASDSYLGDASRYQTIDYLLDRRGPWTDEQFVGGSSVSGHRRFC
jgi:hypothetical protein